MFGARLPRPREAQNQGKRCSARGYSGRTPFLVVERAQLLRIFKCIFAQSFRLSLRGLGRVFCIHRGIGLGPQLDGHKPYLFLEILTESLRFLVRARIAPSQDTRLNQHKRDDGVGCNEPRRDNPCCRGYR